MNSIKVSCIKDSNGKFYFIFEFDKTLLKYFKVKSTDKIMVMSNDRFDRFFLLPSPNGYVIKRTKSKTYAINFYAAAKIEFKEFIDKNCTYFYRNGMIIVFTDYPEISI